MNQDVNALSIDRNTLSEFFSRINPSQQGIKNLLTGTPNYPYSNQDSLITSNYLYPNQDSSMKIDKDKVINHYFPKIKSEQREKLIGMIGSSSSFNDFYSDFQSLLTEMKKKAEEVRKKPLKNRINTFAGEVDYIPNYIINILNKISQIKVLYSQDLRKPLGEDEANKILSLKTRREGSKVLNNIQKTVSTLLGVEIDAFDTGLNESKTEIDVDNFLLEVNGSGIRDALKLVLDYEFQKPHILFIEEPEVHLHPALEINLMQYLKKISSDCQIFISTHSTNFLDTSDMKNVYLVQKPKSTQIQLLDYEEAQAQIPKELGIRLSSIFMYDRLAFVEGQTDEAVLREWASKLGIKLSQSNVGFITMEGARNFAHFATEKTLSFMAKRNINMWFVLDRDEKDDAEIAKLQKKLGKNATLRILDKREIENYLICPRAIREFIRLKKELTSDGDMSLPDESDIIKNLQEQAEKLKQIAIDKRVVKTLCKPIYPSLNDIFEETQVTPITKKVDEEIKNMIEQLKNGLSKIDDVYKSKVELLNSDWETNKLNVVPGDLLLDNLCKEYGVRFKKEQDSVRLAAIMNEDEIDETMKSIIHEIGD